MKHVERVASEDVYDQVELIIRMDKEISGKQLKAMKMLGEHNDARKKSIAGHQYYMDGLGQITKSIVQLP